LALFLAFFLVCHFTSLIFYVLLLLAQFLAFFTNRFDLLQDLVIFEVFQPEADVYDLRMVDPLFLWKIGVI